MIEERTTAQIACRGYPLSVSAGQTLLFDRDQMLAAADEAGITIVGAAAPRG